MHTEAAQADEIKGFPLRRVSSGDPRNGPADLGYWGAGGLKYIPTIPRRGYLKLLTIMIHKQVSFSNAPEPDQKSPLASIDSHSYIVLSKYI